MTTNRDDLVAAVDRLEQTLGTPGNGDALRRALGGLEDALWQHAAVLAGPDGPLPDIDRPLLPSPGVSRRTEELRQQLDNFLTELRALRTKARGLAAPSGTTRPDTMAGALPVAPEMGAAVDYGVICARARDLIADLQQFEEEEEDLILHSVNTDIGAGD